ncbi:MAG: hypothetical protein WA810_10580 [Maribacter sp.]
MTVLVFALIAYAGFSQDVLNEYKYIIVPKRFEAFRTSNQHQSSTLIKYLFSERKFTVVYDDALPEDLLKDRCLGLSTDIVDESNMFNTKTAIVLKDCLGKEIFRTMQGVSREKEFKTAYTEAIKEAMNSFSYDGHAYNGKPSSKENEVIIVSFKNDVKQLNEQNVNKTNPSTSQTESMKNSSGQKGDVVTQVATETEQYYKDRTPVSSTIRQGNTETALLKPTQNGTPITSDLWYAQPTENGFQLVDSTPKVRMNLLKSSTDNVYMAQTDAKNGMVYQKEGQWIFEYYTEGQLVQEVLNLKF